ncbi:MAG: hypothetical protein DRP45_02330 [Candidatus Zixiibacteriota bacterium]|nr:MAG: hypothetical protein DRP45_02330 [candidate division Zixibacteria bacterium]
MRLKMIIIAVLLAVALGFSTSQAQETEQDVLDRYIKAGEEKHTTKLGWASFNFSLNRINKNNPYNDFAVYESERFDNGEISQLGYGSSFGADFGIVFWDKYAWSIGGEYWLRLGEKLSGNYDYTPIGASVTDPVSEIKVYSFNTGVQYYLLNPPTKTGKLNSLAVRAGGTVGYYFATWYLWPEYQSLNLATSEATEDNIAFRGNAPGFSFNIGADYPLGVWDLAIGADMSYLYLNFKNVAWYNSNDEEIVATYDGTTEGRVDLDLSGVRGKIEVKRFFNW